MQKNINIFSHVWTPVPEQMADFTASCFCHQMSHWFHTGVETQSSTNSLKRNLPTTNHYQRSTITQICLIFRLNKSQMSAAASYWNNRAQNKPLFINLQENVGVTWWINKVVIKMVSFNSFDGSHTDSTQRNDTVFLCRFT